MTVELWAFSYSRPRHQGRLDCRVAAPTFKDAWALVLKDIDREATMLKAEKIGPVHVEVKS